jgi:hypothetical protein
MIYWIMQKEVLLPKSMSLSINLLIRSFEELTENIDGHKPEINIDKMPVIKVHVWH